MEKMKVLIACFVFLIFGHGVLAMTSTNFQINWDSLNEGGLDTSTSTNFSSYDTLGDLATGTSTSANFQLHAGYRAVEGGEVLTFVLKSQTPGTQTAYTAFSDGGKTVTVASTSSFSVGDYVAVIEDLGFSEKVAVGKITSIGGAVITVDDWNGANGSMSAVPGGGDDFVYRLSGSAAAFGAVSAGTANTSVTMPSVVSSIPTGYTVYIQANQILQNAGAQTIASVADGAVSVGSEEYGASVTGTRAFNPDTDIAVTTTQRIIQTSLVPSSGVPDRVVMTYKLSITGGTSAGNYSQNVFYTLTPNY